jgi:hypothetical protein
MLVLQAISVPNTATDVYRILIFEVQRRLILKTSISFEGEAVPLGELFQMEHHLGLQNI